MGTQGSGIDGDGEAPKWSTYAETLRRNEVLEGRDSGLEGRWGKALSKVDSLVAESGWRMSTL